MECLLCYQATLFIVGSYIGIRTISGKSLLENMGIDFPVQCVSWLRCPLVMGFCAHYMLANVIATEFLRGL